MADTTTKQTYLINFQDNLDAYAQNAEDAKKEVDRLTAANKELLASGKASQADIEKSNAALRTAQQEYKNAQKNVDLATKANKANKGSHEELYRQWQLAQTQLKLLANTYTTNSDGVKVLSQEYINQSKVVANAKKALNDFNLGVHDGRLNTGLYGEALEKAAQGFSMLPGPLGQAAGGVKALGKQFLMLLANPIVALIAAIAAALIGLFKAFTSTDKGATEMAARMEQLKAIFDVIRQRAIALLGALKSLFSGDFKKAGEQFKATFTGIGEQMNEAAKAAYNYKFALDAIEDSQNNFISRAAEIRNAIAKLEFTAADRTKSTAERRKALLEAIALGEEATKFEGDQRKKRLDEEAKYLAEKAGLQQQDVINFIQMTDEQQAAADQSLQDLRNNNEAKFKEIEELYASWLDADTKFYDENKRNQARASQFFLELKKEEDEAREAQRVERLRREAEAATAEMQQQLEILKAGQDAKEVALVQSNEKQITLNQQFAERRAKALAIEYESAQALLETTLFGQFEVEQQQLEEKKAAEIAAAEAVGASTLAIQERYAKAENAIETAKRDAKLALAQGAAQNLADIFGETTAAGKAAAVAVTTIETFRGAQAAFTGMTEAIPGPVGIAAGIVAAAAAVAIGVANVKKILAVKTPKGGGGGNASISAGGQSGISTAASRVTAQPLGPTVLQPLQSAQTVTQQQQQQTLTADAIAQAISSMPPPVVTVEDINAKTTEANKVAVQANV